MLRKQVVISSLTEAKTTTSPFTVYTVCALIYTFSSSTSNLLPPLLWRARLVLRVRMLCFKETKDKDKKKKKNVRS